jgi:hypothetical protein
MPATPSDSVTWPRSTPKFSASAVTLDVLAESCRLEYALT